jgi:hypothetical protein
MFLATNRSSMQLANTKTVRNIVNKIVGFGAQYTDKGVNNTRLLTWKGATVDSATIKEIQDLFTLAGFSNRIKVTQSAYDTMARNGGWHYLRINASYKK